MRVGVFGAGAIGASMGVRLSSVGVRVRMVARASLVGADLVAEGRNGREFRPGRDFVVSEDPRVLADVDVCLVTVKSRDTDAAGRMLANVLGPSAIVVSFQNGLRNAARLREHLSIPVVAGMVGYNVVRPSPAEFRQATKAPLVAGTLNGHGGELLADLRRFFSAADDELELTGDVENVMAGKLLLNLNNGVCAITGTRIAESLRDRTLRGCFAALILEGSSVMRAAGMAPRSVIGIPPVAIARLLPLPNSIVLRVARAMVDIDPSAMSSTLQDLHAGKPTEIDDLSGEIVRLSNGAAPLNATIVDGIHELERAGTPIPFWSPEELARRFAQRSRAF